MSFSAEKAQSSFEVLMVAAIIIVAAVVLSGYYFGQISNQTLATVILKTELLNFISKQDSSYVIVSSLEPKLLANGALCFNVKTRPDNLTIPVSNLDAIKAAVSSRTTYGTVDLRVNPSPGNEC